LSKREERARDTDGYFEAVAATETNRRQLSIAAEEYLILGMPVAAVCHIVQYICGVGGDIDAGVLDLVIQERVTEGRPPTVTVEARLSAGRQRTWKKKQSVMGPSVSPRKSGKNYSKLARRLSVVVFELERKLKNRTWWLESERGTRELTRECSSNACANNTYAIVVRAQFGDIKARSPGLTNSYLP
jgi:hypothetical protein